MVCPIAGMPALLPSWLCAPPKQPTNPGANASKKAAAKALAATRVLPLQRPPVAAATAAAAALGATAASFSGHKPPPLPWPAAAAPGPPLKSEIGGTTLPWALLPAGPAKMAAFSKPVPEPQTPRRADAMGGEPHIKRRRSNKYGIIRNEERCGQCKTCLNRAMKKACLTRRAELEAMAGAATMPAAAAATAPHMAAAVAAAAAAAPVADTIANFARFG